ncbi:1798_t:CDS:2, partial [Acaulospora colombiana]
MEEGKAHPTEFSEKLSILHACLKLGDIERAGKIWQNLHDIAPNDMIHLLNISVHNAFLEALVETSEPAYYETALRWLDELDGYGLKPDMMTFTILIRGFLRFIISLRFLPNLIFHPVATHQLCLKLNSEIKGLSLLKAMIYEMEQNGFTIEQLVKSRLLLDEDIVQLIELFVNEEDPDRDSHFLLDKLTGLHKSERNTVTPVQSIEQIPVVNGESASAVPGSPPVQSSTKVAIGVKLMKSTLGALKETQLSEYERQIRLEENALHAAIERWKYEHEQMRKVGKQSSGFPSIKKYMWDWHETLVPMIEDELKKCRDPRGGLERAQYGPFLQLLSADKLSAITIMEMMRQNSAGGIIDGMKTTRGIMAIGKAVESEYNISRDLNIQELFASGKLFNMTIRRAAARIEREDLDTTWKPEWPQVVRAKIGSVLAAMLIEVAKLQVSTIDANGKKITEIVPAFFHSYEYSRGKKIGVIKLNPQLIKLLSAESIGEHLHPRMLPMLIHPKPWLTYNSGGYFTSPTLVMRTKECPEQIAYLKKASELQYLERVFAGLDVLGSTCWTINKKVYDVVIEIWNSGKGMANIPPVDLNLEMPEKPPDFGTNLISKVHWMKTCKDITQKIRNNYGLRCSVNYKVDIAGA